MAWKILQNEVLYQPCTEPVVVKSKIEQRHEAVIAVHQKQDPDGFLFAIISPERQRQRKYRAVGPAQCFVQEQIFNR